MSEREFCLNTMQAWGIVRTDCEDIFSDLIRKWLASEREGRLPAEINRGLLIAGLRQLKIDDWRRKTAARRGGGCEHVSFEEQLIDSAVVGFSFPDDRRWYAIPMLRGLRTRARGRKLILLDVMIGVIREGRSIDSWTEAFTPETRTAFMRDSSGGDGADRRFAKQVSRTFSEILKEIERITKAN